LVGVHNDRRSRRYCGGMTDTPRTTAERIEHFTQRRDAAHTGNQRSVDNQHKRGKQTARDRKSTRLNSSHVSISYAVSCLKKNKTSAAHRNSARVQRAESAETERSHIPMVKHIGEFLRIITELREDFRGGTLHNIKISLLQ